jgi:hypothetical protein
LRTQGVTADVSGWRISRFISNLTGAYAIPAGTTVLLLACALRRRVNPMCAQIGAGKYYAFTATMLGFSLKASGDSVR